MFKQPDQPTFKTIKVERTALFYNIPEFRETIEIIFEKIDNRVTLQFVKDLYFKTVSTSIAEIDDGTIPEGFRPLSNVSISYSFQYSSSSHWILEVNTNGGITIKSAEVRRGNPYFATFTRANSITYMV